MSGAKIFSEFLSAGWTAYADLGTRMITMRNDKICCEYWGSAQSKDSTMILLINDAYDQERDLLEKRAKVEHRFRGRLW
jgi:hypothetical protein